ncbi:MAG: hypothetical protein KGL39_00145 [Patescibacteria group bacterium]|nr:hypothetical protein [Patescibacteria group bacterium]
MPGSWEIRAANQVLVGTLHVDVTTLAWAFGIRNLIIPGRDDLRQFYPFLPVAGMPFDHARNVICQKALEYGAQYVLMLDSDVIPPRDTIIRLMAHNLPLVSGMYCRRSPPHGVPVMIKEGQWITNFVPGSLVEADVVGSGCLLIHRSVLEAMSPSDKARGKQWFDWRVDMRGTGTLPDGLCMSEDFVFCANARQQLGIKAYVDTSIVCKHIGYAQAGLGTFTPLDCQPIT